MAEAFVFHVGLRRPLAPPEMLRVMPEVQRLLPRDCCVQVLPEVVCVYGPPDGRGGGAWLGEAAGRGGDGWGAGGWGCPDNLI